MRDQQPPADPLSEVRGLGAVALLFARMLSAGARPWVKRPGTWGGRAFDARDALGVLLMPAFGVAAHERFGAAAGYPAFLLFFFATLAMLAAHAVARGRRRARGEPVPHSRYAGDGWVPLGCEPPLFAALCLAAGAALQSVAVVAYGVAAAVALGVTTAVAEQEWEAKVRAARDAKREAELMAAYLEKED